MTVRFTRRPTSCGRYLLHTEDATAKDIELRTDTALEISQAHRGDGLWFYANGEFCDILVGFGYEVVEGA